MIRAQRRAEPHKLYGKLLRQVTGPLVLAVAIFYFTFHALSGERGIYAMLKEERKLEVLNAELKDVVTKRRDLENRTRQMEDGSLDLDLLDEQTRLMLNEAGEDELVVPTAAPQTSAEPHAN